MNIDLHGVKHVELTEIRELFSNSYVRDIIVKCYNGQEVNFSLYTRGPSEQLVFHEDSLEDWK